MFWSQRWRNFGIFLSYISRYIPKLIIRYIVFNLFAIFFFFYITRIRRLDKKKSTKKSRISVVKETALRVGKNLEEVMIRKNDGDNDKQGVDHSMNSANFSIFQGVGLETFDSRGLGRQWTRKDEQVD
jgi:hypothetical protein